MNRLCTCRIWSLAGVFRRPSEALFGDCFFCDSWRCGDDARILGSCASEGSITRMFLPGGFGFSPDMNGVS